MCGFTSYYSKVSLFLSKRGFIEVRDGFLYLMVWLFEQLNALISEQILFQQHKNYQQAIPNQILTEHNGRLEGTFLGLQIHHTEFQRSTVIQ